MFLFVRLAHRQMKSHQPYGFWNHSRLLFLPIHPLLRAESAPAEPSHSVRGEVLGINPTVDGIFGYAQVGSHVCDSDPTFFGRHSRP